MTVIFRESVTGIQADYAKSAKVAASGYTHGNEPWKVLNGIARQEQEESNCWEAPIGEQGAEITLTYDGKLVLHQIQLTFDTNLTKRSCHLLQEMYGTDR